MTYVSCRHLVAILLGFLFASQPQLRADIKNPADLERAPVPLPQKVSVVRGETVEITLQGLTANTKDVLFLLRTQPSDGRLLDAEPIRKTKTSATVRYQSNNQSTLTTDSFKYAVRLEGGSVSPSETVQISITDVKPKIEVIEKLDAGNVRLGQDVQLPITIKNVGNGPFEQPVLLPSGWAWPAGMEKISVAPGKSTIVKLTYRPESIGLSEGIILFGNAPKSQINIRGNGLPPIEVAGVVYLKWNSASFKREMNLPLKNPSLETVTIKFESLENKLQHPTELTLAPQEERVISLSLNEAPSSSFRGNLAMTVRGLIQIVEVTAEPAPAFVVMSGAADDKGVVDFGTVTPVQIPTLTKEIKLSNKGGTSVTLFGNAPSGFVMTGFENGMALLPGSETTCKIQIKQDAQGKLRNILNWSWDKNPVTIDLKAEVSRESAQAVEMVNAPAAAGPVGNPLLSEEPGIVDRAALENRASILPTIPAVDRSLPVVTDVYQKSETNDSVTIAWPLLKGRKYNYMVLERVIAPVDGFPRQMWPPARNCTVTPIGDEAVAVISKLEPGWQNAIRISAVAENGHFSLPSEPATFMIPYPPAFNWTPWLLGIFTVLLIFYWRHWKQKNAPLPRSYRSREHEST